MKRTLSEQKVLNKLGISDFRHLSKDKIVQFVSMLPYMDPEVAKKAIEQFPSFAEYAGKVVAEYKSMVEAALNENSDSQKAFYRTCDGILSSLERELQKESLSQEERTHIEDGMLKIAQMIYDKDSENKCFILKVITVVGITLAGITATAAAILGANHQATFPKEVDAG